MNDIAQPKEASRHGRRHSSRNHMHHHWNHAVKITREQYFNLIASGNGTSGQYQNLVYYPDQRDGPRFQNILAGPGGGGILEATVRAAAEREKNLRNSEWRAQTPVKWANEDCSKIEEQKDEKRYSGLGGAILSLIENRYSIFGAIHRNKNGIEKKQCVIDKTSDNQLWIDEQYKDLLEKDAHEAKRLQEQLQGQQKIKPNRSTKKIKTTSI